MLLGLVYPLIADKSDNLLAQLNGLLIGIFGGLAIIFYELYVFFLPRKIYSFSFILFNKIVTYTVTFLLLIILIVSFTRSLNQGVSIFAFMRSEHLKHFLFEEDFHVIALYTLAAVFIVITTRQISRKMGPGELFHYVIGKYHKPKREHRIFLAIDLRDSTTMAEQLGELKYHEFLKRYFYDLTYSIAAHGGQIYRYVGDQVTISWLLEKGLKNSNVIRCFFSAKKFIESREHFYMLNFGVNPTFRGAIDMGEVLTAEIGLDKQQLVFYGDVMLRLSAIEKSCKQEKQDLLLSEFLAVPLRQSRDFRYVRCTSLQQDGIEPVQLLTASEVH